MAKKKSKRFIIPSFHFLTTTPQISEPAKVAVPERDAVQQTVARKEAKKQSLSAPTRPKSLEKPKPLTVKPGERRNSALSLSSLKRNKQEEEERIKKNKEEREQQKDLPKDPFTEETFMEVWNTYVNDLHTKGEKILSSILKADVPKLKGTQIHVTYPNELMKVELLKVRPKVLRYIRKKLNNYEVDFEISVNENTTKRFAYTPQEKYELLKEKNEAISLLRKKFNLEL